MSIEHGIDSSRAPDPAPRNWRSRDHDGDRSGMAQTARVDDLSFWDVLDVINPLQHIPLLSVAYREITGDQLHPTARVLGGALYGGPLGLMAGAMNAAFEQETGRDIAGNAMAVLRGEEIGGPASGPQLAEAGAAARDRPLPQLDLGPVAGAATPTSGPDAPPMPQGPAPDAAVAGARADRPALPGLDLAPVPGRTAAATGDGPVRVDAGLDAALRTLASSTGDAAGRPADAAAAYRTRQSAG
jgi:hypothetical protein